MITIYAWSIIFFCIGYLIITDSSIATLFVLLWKWTQLQYEKLKWWILYSPDNILVKWAIHRKSLKMAEDLMKEFENNKDQ